MISATLAYPVCDATKRTYVKNREAMYDPALDTTDQWQPAYPQPHVLPVHEALTDCSCQYQDNSRDVISENKPA